MTAVGTQMEPNGDWKEYKRLILATAESQDKDLKEIKLTLAEIKTDIALLKFKSSLWGAAGAAIVLLAAKLATR